MKINKQIGYAEDKTEFLTENGWKKYNNIDDSEKIASINIDGKLVFDNFLYRFRSNYSGVVYEYESRYTKFSITANHNLLLHYLHRSISNSYSTKLDVDNIENFEYIEVDKFIKSRKNYSNILNLSLHNYNDDEYDLTDEEIKILGGYISDGSLASKQIRIDQKENKQLFNFLSDSAYSYTAEYIGSYTGEKYHYFRYRNLKLYNFIVKNVGLGSIKKYLSNEFWKFSKRQFLILLEYMLKGDGSHNKKNGHDIYYTSSKKLAIDLHTLCFLNGLSTQIYDVNHKGGFENSSELKYQVFLSKKVNTFCYFNKKNNWNIKNVKDISICHFGTIHNNIITKNNNKMAIQG